MEMLINVILSSEIRGMFPLHLACFENALFCDLRTIECMASCSAKTCGMLSFPWTPIFIVPVIAECHWRLLASN